MNIRSNLLTTILIITILGIVLTTGCLQETSVINDQDAKVEEPDDTLPIDT